MFHTMRTRNRIRNLPSATAACRYHTIAWVASLVIIKPDRTRPVRVR